MCQAHSNSMTLSSVKTSKALRHVKTSPALRQVRPWEKSGPKTSQDMSRPETSPALRHFKTSLALRQFKDKSGLEIFLSMKKLASIYWPLFIALHSEIYSGICWFAIGQVRPQINWPLFIISLFYRLLCIVISYTGFSVLFSLLTHLKYGFCKKSLRKNETLTSCPFFPSFLSLLVGCNSKPTQKW